MIEELIFNPRFRDEKSGFAYSWLIALSLLKDDVPWLYEPGMDFYRALLKGRPQEIQKTRDALLRVVEFTQRSKMFYRFLRESEESGFVFRHLSDIVFRFVRGASLRELEEEEDEDEMKVVKKGE